jgi:hypothetical protein
MRRRVLMRHRWFTCFYYFDYMGYTDTAWRGY